MDYLAKIILLFLSQSPFVVGCVVIINERLREFVEYSTERCHLEEFLETPFCDVPFHQEKSILDIMWHTLSRPVLDGSEKGLQYGVEGLKCLISCEDSNMRTLD
jgi:hypothetical protein